MANLIDREYRENNCINYAQGHYSSQDNSFRGIEEQYNAYKFPEREKELIRKRKEFDIEREEHLERQRIRNKERTELNEYRERLRVREEELARTRKKSEEQRMIYLGGSDHGRYIITNSGGKVRQG